MDILSPEPASSSKAGRHAGDRLFDHVIGWNA
jgi:hypothetical protein